MQSIRTSPGKFDDVFFCQWGWHNLCKSTRSTYRNIDIIPDHISDTMDSFCHLVNRNFVPKAFCNVHGSHAFISTGKSKSRVVGLDHAGACLDSG